MNLKALLSPSAAAVVMVYVYVYNSEGSLCVLGGRRGATAPTGAGFLNPPMGYVEDGELYEDAALREVVEESGLVLRKSDLHDLGSWVYAGGLRVSQAFVVALSGLDTDYVLGVGDGENEQFEWLGVSDLDVSDWAWSTGARVLNYASVAEDLLG